MQLHNKVGTGTEFSDKRRTFPVFLDRAGNLLTETELAMARTYDEELKFLEKVSSTGWRIKKGFVPNMKVEGFFYVNDHLEGLMFEELKHHSASKGVVVGGVKL
jgi:hypothetical protein